MSTTGRITILEVDGEGVSISLIGKRVDGAMLFRVETDGSALISMLDDEDKRDLPPRPDRPWVSAWTEALGQLDRYRWAAMRPQLIHPDYKQRIHDALEKRDRAGGIVDWHRWNHCREAR